MACRPLLRDATEETLETIAEKHGYSSMDRAITHVLREQGYEL